MIFTIMVANERLVYRNAKNLKNKISGYLASKIWNAWRYRLIFRTRLEIKDVIDFVFRTRFEI